MINLYESINNNFGKLLTEAYNDIVVVDAPNMLDAVHQLDKDHTTLMIKGQPGEEFPFNLKRFVTKLILPDAIYIPDDFFSWGYYGKDSPLTTVVAPNVTFVSYGAFAGCKNLRKVVMPELELIGVQAFRGCRELPKIDLTNAKEIGENAFTGCESLKKVTFNKEVKIENYAFRYCTSLREVYVPSEALCSANAFKDCNLDVLKFPRSTVRIESVDISDYYWNRAYCYGTLMVAEGTVLSPEVKTLFRKIVMYD